MTSPLELMLLSQQQIMYPSLPPSGAVIMFAGTSAPTGWLLCDGSAVSRTDYASLFASIGTRYGGGDGYSTFNLPDIQGVFPLGSTSPGQTGGSDYHSHGLDNAYAEITTNASYGAVGTVVYPGIEYLATLRGPNGVNNGGPVEIAEDGATPLIGQTDDAYSMPPFITMLFIVKT